MDTCKEFNIRYFEFPTFSEAIMSNLKLLKELGRKPKAYGGDYEFKSKVD